MKRNGPLKNPQGVRLTQSLFVEMPNDDLPPSYTMKDYDYEKDGIVYPSLRRLYMDCMDPTEHAFVTLAFDGDWDHWKKIKANDLLVTKLKYNEWEEELSAKLRSTGMRGLVRQAQEGNVNAARWLAEGSWKSKRGRPSKAEKEGMLRQDALLEKEFAEDLKRLGLES